MFFFVSKKYKDKSNYWLYLYIQNYFKRNYPDYTLKLIDDLNDRNNDDYIILVDDCIYSGTQIGETILSLRNIKNKDLFIYILCPYISLFGLNNFKLDFSDNRTLNNCRLIINKHVINPNIINKILSVDEINILKKYLDYVGNLMLIYFDHKLADLMSTLTHIYSGFVLNNKNSILIKSYQKINKNNADFIPVINNCKNSKNIDFMLPICPITPYKKTFKEFIKDFKSNNNIKYKSSPLKSKKEKILNKSI